jgi:hypothetical protein
LFFGSSRALAAAGVVHLKNGGWVEGDVMEVVPDQHVTIRLRDNSVREIAWGQVDHIEKSPAPNSVAPVPPAPEPPPARWQQHPARWQQQPDPESWQTRGLSDERPHRLHQRARRDAMAKLPTLAFLGQVTIGGSLDAEARQGSDSESESESLLPGYGIGGEFSVPVSRFFALGALINYSRLKGHDAAESVGFLDGAFVPRLQYAFGGDPVVMRVFFEVQIGVGWADLPNVTTSAATSITPVFDVGPSGGIELFASSHVGFLLKFGWRYHLFGFDAFAANGLKGSLTLEYQTLVLQLGVLFALGSVAEYMPNLNALVGAQPARYNRAGACRF